MKPAGALRRGADWNLAAARPSITTVHQRRVSRRPSSRKRSDGVGHSILANPNQ